MVIDHTESGVDTIISPCRHIYHNIRRKKLQVLDGHMFLFSKKDRKGKIHKDRVSHKEHVPFTTRIVFEQSYYKGKAVNKGR